VLTHNPADRNAGAYDCRKTIPYLPAHKTHHDLVVRDFIKQKEECILISVI
jgi:hypothetical protein